MTDITDRATEREAEFTEDALTATVPVTPCPPAPFVAASATDARR